MESLSNNEKLGFFFLIKIYFSLFPFRNLTCNGYSLDHFKLRFPVSVRVDPAAAF